MQLTLNHLKQALAKAKLAAKDLLYVDEVAVVEAEIHMLTNLIVIMEADYDNHDTFIDVMSGENE